MNLTNAQIREVMQHAYHRGAQPKFLQTYAAAVLQAPASDFDLMRPVSVSMIQKYELWRYLMGEQPPLKPTLIDGDIARRGGRKLMNTCPRCGHIHQGEECGEDLGGAGKCSCEYSVPA